MVVYFNGEIIEKERFSEILEPGYLFGWGVFEVLRVYRGKPYLLDKHIERLEKALSIVEIDVPKIDWRGTIDDLLKENNLAEAYLRITVYKRRKDAGIIIYTDKFTYYPQEVYQKGFKAIIYPHRLDTSQISFLLKSLSYLEKRIAWAKAQKQKKDEALIVNKEGYLTGGSRTNLFIIKKGKVFTPSHKCGVFKGITRDKVMEIIKEKLNLEVKEEKLTVDELYTCQEAFLTSSLVEVMPLRECEGKEIGEGKPGEITSQILKEYRNQL